jgi:four helix bundle protein
MANIRSFKELKVWQNAMDAAMRVFELTKKFPNEEKFSMTDQFRRASRSVATNVAEAWRKRRYPAAFVSKLNDAEGEAAESQTWTELALRCGYLSDSEASELDCCYERILAQLVRMIDHPDDWTVGANRPPRVPASPGPRVNSRSPRPRVNIHTVGKVS